MTNTTILYPQIDFRQQTPAKMSRTLGRSKWSCDLPNYRDHFGFENDDAMMGDSILFKRADMIEGGWAIVQPILGAWASGRGGILHKYSAGSEEHSAAGEMLHVMAATGRTFEADA